MKKILLVAVITLFATALYCMGYVNTADSFNGQICQNADNYPNIVKNSKMRNIKRMDTNISDSCKNNNIINKNMTVQQKKDAISKLFSDCGYDVEIDYNGNDEILKNNNHLPDITCQAISEKLIEPYKLHNRWNYKYLFDEDTMVRVMSVNREFKQLNISCEYYMDNIECDPEQSRYKDRYDAVYNLFTLRRKYNISHETFVKAFIYNDNLKKAPTSYKILQLMAAANQVSDEEIKFLFSQQNVKSKWWNYDIILNVSDTEITDIYSIYNVLYQQYGANLDYIKLRKEYVKLVVNRISRNKIKPYWEK